MNWIVYHLYFIDDDDDTAGAGSSVRIRIGGRARSPTETVDVTANWNPDTLDKVQYENYQDCGSGSAWIRIQFHSRIRKMKGKKIKISRIQISIVLLIRFHPDTTYWVPVPVCWIRPTFGIKSTSRTLVL